MPLSSAAAYVALGDSISIDDYAGGPGRGGASLLFRNHDDDFPQWRGRDLASRHHDAAFVMLAADGATTRSLQVTQLPRLVALGLRPTPAELNDGLRQAASGRGARVAEIAERFQGHGLLAGDPAQPDPRPAQRGLWFCHVIEPNAWGASGVREAFWAALTQ